MAKFVLFFFVYAFIGWCTEVAYAALEEGKFVNRGFLFGPVCPIYGFGVNLVLLVINPFKDNLALLFLVSCLLTTSVELVGGFLMKKLFHQTWWDYSDKKFNLGGYICLSFSILWGLACVLVVDVVHPIINAAVNPLPDYVLWIINSGFGAVFLADLFATVLAVVKMNRRIAQIQEVATALHNVSDKIGTGVADRTLTVLAKAEKTKETVKEKQDVLVAAMKDQKDALSEGTRQRIDGAKLRIEEAKEYLDEIRNKSDDEEQRASLEGRLRTLYAALGKEQKRFLRAFPHLQSTRRRELWDAVRVFSTTKLLQGERNPEAKQEKTKK